MAYGEQQGMLEGDDTLFVRFYMGSVKNEFRSEQEGHPIFEEKPFVQIIVPGDRNAKLDVPVRESDKTRFPLVWERFLKAEGTIETMVGMPLREWPSITRSLAEELSYLNIFTVEQLATLSDTHAQKVVDFHNLKRKAQAYLDAAKDSALNQKLAAQNTALQTQIDAMQVKMDEYTAAFAAMQAQQGHPSGEQHGTRGSSNRR